MLEYWISAGGCTGVGSGVTLGSCAQACSIQVVTFMVVKTEAPTMLAGATCAATLFTACDTSAQ